ncbi:hypothetical protein J6590_074963 [Homalodisca vitripennis]|nr:hypothetical protein J6590_074963 [Homalodisca vitripennis]
MGKMREYGRPPIEVQEELGHYISKSCLSGSEPASPVKGTNPTNSNSHLQKYTRPIELPIDSRISKFAVAQLSDTSVLCCAQWRVQLEGIIQPEVIPAGNKKSCYKKVVGTPISAVLSSELSSIPRRKDITSPEGEDGYILKTSH